MIELHRDVATERASEHLRDRDALPRAGVEMIDEGHVNVAREEGELDRAQLIKGPAFSAAPSGDRFIPDRRYFFAE